MKHIKLFEGFLNEDVLTEGATYKAFENLIQALSKYKNTRAGSGNPVAMDIYEEVEELIRRL